MILRHPLLPFVPDNTSTERTRPDPSGTRSSPNQQSSSQTFTPEQKKDIQNMLDEARDQAREQGRRVGRDERGRERENRETCKSRRLRSPKPVRGSKRPLCDFLTEIAPVD